VRCCQKLTLQWYLVCFPHLFAFGKESHKFHFSMKKKIFFLLIVIYDYAAHPILLVYYWKKKHYNISINFFWKINILSLFSFKWHTFIDAFLLCWRLPTQMKYFWCYLFFTCWHIQVIFYLLMFYWTVTKCTWPKKNYVLR
jgi:hypothetical protein